MGDNTNNEEQLTLGKKLRLLTNKARSEAEINNFYKVLEEAANRGEDRVQFVDLRQYLNTMILDGTVWDWLKSQELYVTGEINQNTGEYGFTILWT